jgi:hypothetical protein
MAMQNLFYRNILAEDCNNVYRMSPATIKYPAKTTWPDNCVISTLKLVPEKSVQQYGIAIPYCC